eukprot:12434624-Alexandrium_andersonii.AAC.1
MLHDLGVVLSFGGLGFEEAVDLGMLVELWGAWKHQGAGWANVVERRLGVDNVTVALQLAAAQAKAWANSLKLRTRRMAVAAARKQLSGRGALNRAHSLLKAMKAPGPLFLRKEDGSITADPLQVDRADRECWSS